MNFKVIWTNYKIYAFFLGIILGTIVYNLLGIDFSFDKINKIEFEYYIDGFLFILLQNLKIWMVIFVLSFFRIKDKIILVIIFYYSFLLAGIITVSINAQTTLLLYGCAGAIAKILGGILMCDDAKKAKGRIFSFLILIVGSLLENVIIFMN